MTYDGWLAYGGNEIANNARTMGYAMTATSCPLYWFKGDICEGIYDALGETYRYTYTNIALAPWYDSVNADVSSRFFGVFITDVENVQTSTRQVAVVEGLGDGGILGAARKGVREVRVKAILVGDGRDALEYGMAWLSRVLDADACGIHGTGCGTADLTFFGDCPPIKGAVKLPVTTYLPISTNLFSNPKAVSAGAAAMFGSVTVGTASYITSFPGTITSARRHTANATTAGARLLALQTGATTPGSGGQVRVRFKVNASHQYTAVAVHARPDITAATNQTVLTLAGGGSTIPAGQSVVEAYGTSFASAAAAASGITLTGTPTNAAATLDITEITVEQSGDPGAVFFDGDTPTNTTDRFTWTGAVNASPSLWESITIVQTPSLSEWQKKVTGLQRYLHDVGATTGPLITATHNADDFYANEVEFILTAEKPWVYKVTEDIPESISTPVVIQDIPFNLIPYPSAELAGANVAVSTNFVTNPSAEAAITGWTLAADGTLITTAMLAAAAVSTELKSAGLQSAKTTFTASTTSAAGWFALEQIVQLPGILATTRYSVNLWASANVESGTAVAGNIEVHAYWQNAGGTVLRDDTIGTMTAAGGAVTQRSILPPSGTTRVLIRAMLRVTSWSTGAKVRLYTDVASVTNP